VTDRDVLIYMVDRSKIFCGRYERKDVKYRDASGEFGPLSGEIAKYAWMYGNIKSVSAARSYPFQEGEYPCDRYMAAGDNVALFKHFYDKKTIVCGFRDMRLAVNKYAKYRAVNILQYIFACNDVLGVEFAKQYDDVDDTLALEVLGDQDHSRYQCESMKTAIRKSHVKRAVWLINNAVGKCKSARYLTMFVWAPFDVTEKVIKLYKPDICALLCAAGSGKIGAYDVVKKCYGFDKAQITASVESGVISKDVILNTISRIKNADFAAIVREDFGLV
jgi:hypothetical protein